MNQLSNEKGFTLIELMVAVVIALIVMGGTYYAFQFQHRAYITEEKITEMQQNLRAAMLMLERDIRWAGFDPTMNANVGFTAAGATGFTFTFLADSDGLDNDSDGTPDEVGELETVTYDFNDSYGDGDMDIRRSTGIVVPVAENIEAIEYWYTLSDGTQTTALTPVQLSFNNNGQLDDEDIMAIQVWILARTSRDINRLPDTRIYTTPSGVVLNGGVPFPDADGDGYHFRRRILTATIKCRNMP